MTKNAKVITLVVVMLVAMILSIVMVSVYATTHDDQVSSNGFTITKTGSTCEITGYEGKDETVKIPQKIAGKKVVGIKPGVFKGKTVKNIEFNGKFEDLVLANYVFEGLTQLEYVKLPEGLKQIPEGAFHNCSFLSHITLPSSVEVIGDFAFQGCDKLAYTTDKENDDLETKNKKFYFNANLIKVGKSGFAGCTNLARVVFNDKLEYLGVSAFQKASNLIKVELSDKCLLSKIDDYAFAETRIESKKPTADNKKDTLYIPNLKVIGKGAFASITSNFQYFELSKNIEEVRDEAFAGATYLTTIVYDKDFAPKTFGKAVFKNCYLLNTFKSDLNDLTKPNAFPEKLTVIPELTFSGCYNLLSQENFFVHKDVTDIKDGAFAIYNYTGNDNRQRNSSRKLVIDEENQNYKMITLEGYNRSSTISNPDHEVLVKVNGDDFDLVAYIGGFTTFVRSPEGNYTDCWRKSDMNGNKLTGEADEELYTAFTYLHQNIDLRYNLKTIRPYAFAGVMFDKILIPNSVNKICSNAFYNSKISVVLFDKIDCEFEENAFASMPKNFSNDGKGDGLCIATTSMEAGTIAEQALNLEKDKICVYAPGWQMFD